MLCWVVQGQGTGLQLTPPSSYPLEPPLPRGPHLSALTPISSGGSCNLFVIIQTVSSTFSPLCLPDSSPSSYTQFLFTFTFLLSKLLCDSLLWNTLPRRHQTSRNTQSPEVIETYKVQGAPDLQGSSPSLYRAVAIGVRRLFPKQKGQGLVLGASKMQLCK